MAGPFHFSCIVRDLASTHRFEDARLRTEVTRLALAPAWRRAARRGDPVSLLLLHPTGNAPELNSRRNPDTVSAS
jgi:extradiol dioxygenase family protein